MIRAALLCALCSAGAAEAAQLALPSNAVLAAEIQSGVDSYALPVGPWEAGEIPTRLFEGPVQQQAWRIGATGLTTLQLLRPLRDQLEPQGYEVIFDCETEACGGFDFRFETPVIAEPDMHVDLGDFRFLSLVKGEEAISLLVSRSAVAGYIQITRVGGEAETPLVETDAAPVRAPSPEPLVGSLAETLLAQGRVVLRDLDFEIGSTQLSNGDYASLQALADLMAAEPDLTIALVGHTDSTGGLDVNIDISRQRATAVLERLASTFGVPRTRMEAEGMGYLAPIASNLSEAGREENRRVEAIITSTR
ncbi:OmpA family protein [Cognatishimia sp. MH4019]|uniref:OmpA family protein n=1 Tax=Cognatishimia sp. MH4019 TaxID=2854030 RepID=UPI001CD48B2B|nr:OmpA family protein [Cognatishimia sp. MH4019]